MGADSTRRIRTVRYLSFSSNKDQIVPRTAVSAAMWEAVRLSGETARITFPDKPWEVAVEIQRQNGWASFTIEKDRQVALTCCVAWTMRGSRRAARPLSQIRRDTLGWGDPTWLAKLTAPPAWFGVAVHPFFAASLIPSEIMWFGECERAVTFSILDMAAVADSGQ